MKVRDEISRLASESDKPVLLWLFDRYHFEWQWRFVAKCRFQKYGEFSYQYHRIWEPTREGRSLFEYANTH
jgi:hypothetical protein